MLIEWLDLYNTWSEYYLYNEHFYYKRWNFERKSRTETMADYYLDLTQ